MTQHHLDARRKYAVLGPDECRWHFRYEEDCNDYRGVRWAWRAYRQRPGEPSPTAVGWWTESEVLHRLLVFGVDPLTEDDRIDLGLFLYRGGLEAFLGLGDHHSQGDPSGSRTEAPNRQ